MTERPTQVEIFVDPACPFAWAASRWLVGAAERRGAVVTWKQMSLAVLNEGNETQGAHAARIAMSRRAGRVIAAAADPADIGPLYMALGQRLHTDGRELSDEVVREALSECGLDPAGVGAMDNDRWDAAVHAAHQRSQEALGGTGGSPITVIDGRAFFGPVLTEIPDEADADRLFDGLLALAATRAFAQVERPRVGPPDLREAAA